MTSVLCSVKSSTPLLACSGVKEPAGNIVDCVQALAACVDVGSAADAAAADAGSVFTDLLVGCCN